MSLRVQHVIPCDDEREHDLSSWCWCCPDLVPVGESTLYVHHAADLREAYENLTGDPLPGKFWIRVEEDDDREV
jgi:hypothetical protein